MRYTVHFASATKSESGPHCAATADTEPAITLPPQYEPHVAGVNDPGYSLYGISPIPRNPGRKRVDHD